MPAFSLKDTFIIRQSTHCDFSTPFCAFLYNLKCTVIFLCLEERFLKEVSFIDKAASAKA